MQKHTRTRKKPTKNGLSFKWHPKSFDEVSKLISELNEQESINGLTIPQTEIFRQSVRQAIQIMGPLHCPAPHDEMGEKYFVNTSGNKLIICKELV